MRLIPSNAIDIGQRAEQQDDFGFSDPSNATFTAHGGLLAVVVDGMGGVAHGRASAQAAKAAFLQAYESKSQNETIPEALERSLHAGNQAVLQLGRQAGDYRSVGATLSAAVVWNGQLFWISVGDSALFVVRATRFQRMTVAHEVSDNEQGSMVSSFLGLESLTQIDRSASPVMLQPGDRVLACSDGLFKTLPETEVVRIVASVSPDSIAHELVQQVLALRVADQDNVTALVIACEEEGAAAWKGGAATSGGKSRRGVMVGALVAVLVLAIAGGAYGWYWYRGKQQKQVTDLIEAARASFRAGNCAEVKKSADQLATLGSTLPDAKRPTDWNDQCTKAAGQKQKVDAAYVEVGKLEKVGTADQRDMRIARWEGVKKEYVTLKSMFADDTAIDQHADERIKAIDQDIADLKSQELPQKAPTGGRAAPARKIGSQVPEESEKKAPTPSDGSAQQPGPTQK